ncbi:MAG: aldolase/citrate lyase family protein [Desulfosarcinaceae bacterium]|nr:aldolase/citrate lyase family protein [Desulfosarcinaceae bacterium]
MESTRPLFTNTAKRKMMAGDKTIGAWCQLCSPTAAEIMAQAGFDWLCVDLEHAPTDPAILIDMVRAIEGANVQPYVRAPWNDFVTIKRILDTGVSGVVVPYVNTRQEAEAAVAACKYPPEGVRGMAGSPRAAGYGQRPMDYLQRANAEILVITQVETQTAVKNLDAILEVAALDGVFIGPMDLATSMGYFGDASHTQVQSVIESVEAKALAAGKIVGTVAGSWEQAQHLYARGYQMIMVMADGTALAQLAAERVAAFRRTYRP